MAEVQSRLSEFEAACSSVVIISFGSKDGANRWLQTSGCSLPMFLDEKRNLYKLFNLPCTMKLVWGISSLIKYAEFICSERELFSLEEDDDPHQLGGNFIIDCNGVVEFLHRSKTPVDRPFLSVLLKQVKGFSE